MDTCIGIGSIRIQGYTIFSENPICGYVFLTNEHEIVPISLIEKVDMWIRFIIFEKQLM